MFSLNTLTVIMSVCTLAGFSPDDTANPSTALNLQNGASHHEQ